MLKNFPNEDAHPSKTLMLCGCAVTSMTMMMMLAILKTLMMRPLTARQNLDAVRVAGHWHLIKPGARATHPFLI